VKGRGVTACSREVNESKKSLDIKRSARQLREKRRCGKQTKCPFFDSGSLLTLCFWKESHIFSAAEIQSLTTQDKNYTHTHDQAVRSVSCLPKNMNARVTWGSVCWLMNFTHTHIEPPPIIHMIIRRGDAVCTTNNAANETLYHLPRRTSLEKGPESALNEGLGQPWKFAHSFLYKRIWILTSTPA
jgi:hypothetical protein